MSILPDSVRLAIAPYLTQLHQWFSDQVYAALLLHITDDLLYRLHEHFDFTPLETACAGYHHSRGPGAPVTHPASRLLRALRVGHLYGYSLRQLEHQLQCNLLVRWFAGYSLLDPTPDHTTLERFERWFYQHHPRLFFDTALRQIDADFPDERRKLRSSRNSLRIGHQHRDGEAVSYETYRTEPGLGMQNPAAGILGDQGNVFTFSRDRGIAGSRARGIASKCGRADRRLKRGPAEGLLPQARGEDGKENGADPERGVARVE